MKEEMGTKTERGSRIENPLKRERERKWQPYKGVWNSFLQGLSFYDSLHPFSPPPPPPYTLSHLAQALL